MNMHIVYKHNIPINELSISIVEITYLKYTIGHNIQLVFRSVRDGFGSVYSVYPNLK